MNEVPYSYAQEVRTYFEVLSLKRKHLNEALRHVDQYLSTDFNVFHLIAPNENRISDVLRDILDPQGPHGQGNVFLAAFLKRLDVEVGSTRVPTAHREVRTFRSVTSNRRMDILIDLGTTGIAIETKLGAADQFNQIAAYHEELNRRYGSDYRVVYLTTDGRHPSAYSAGPVPSDDRRQRCWSFELDIVDWLGECQNICRSDKFRWFLRDLVEYLKNEWPHPRPEVTNES